MRAATHTSSIIPIASLLVFVDDDDDVGQLSIVSERQFCRCRRRRKFNCTIFYCLRNASWPLHTHTVKSNRTTTKQHTRRQQQHQNVNCRKSRMSYMHLYINYVTLCMPNGNTSFLLLPFPNDSRRLSARDVRMFSIHFVTHAISIDTILFVFGPFAVCIVAAVSNENAETNTNYYK